MKRLLDYLIDLMTPFDGQCVECAASPAVVASLCVSCWDEMRGRGVLDQVRRETGVVVDGRDGMRPETGFPELYGGAADRCIPDGPMLAAGMTILAMCGHNGTVRDTEWGRWR